MKHIRLLKNRILTGILASILAVQGMSGYVTVAREQMSANESAGNGDIASETDADIYNDESGVQAENILSYRGDVDEQVESVSNMPMLFSEEGVTPQAASEIPTSYTSEFVTGIKNQNPYGTCWAFATMAASEACINKKYGVTEDLSEWQLAYFTGNVSVADPLGGTAGDSFSIISSDEAYQPAYLKIGGSQTYSVRSLASWRGYVQEEKAPYTIVCNNKDETLDDKYAYEEDSYHLKNAYIINMTDSEEVKKMIMEYGACGSAYYHNYTYFNALEDGTYAEFCDDGSQYSNHAITIIGWNDDFSKENFGTVKPTEDGAWLIRNSWGEGYYDTFWISYEDAVLNSGNAYVYDPVKVDEDYDYNYQYDGGVNDTFLSPETSSTIYAANVYVANGKEELKAVGFYTLAPNYKCTINIYKDIDTSNPAPTDAEPVSTVEITQTYAGYHTVVLPQSVALEAGSRFSIVIKYDNLSGSPAKIGVDSGSSSTSWMVAVSSAQEGQSFASVGGSSWTDVGKNSSVNCRIKAFTDSLEDDTPQEPEQPVEPEQPDEPEQPRIIKADSVALNKTSTTIVKGGTAKLTATVMPENASDKGVNWTTSNGYIATVDSNGVITANHTGTVIITATACDGSGKSAGCTVSVEAPDVTVSYRTHIQDIGWESTYRQNGTMSGTSGKSKRLEAIQINVSGNTDLGIQYVTHCQDYGWLSWSANDEINGTSGESKRLEAIEIKLTGADKDLYDVYYRVHAQDVGWLGWAKNGEPAGTAGYSRRLEGIQIFVVKKGQPIDSSYQGIVSQYIPAYLAKGNSSAYVAGSDSVHVAYQTHVQNIGWQSWRYDGATAGTFGQSKRLEGIKIKLTNKDFSGAICYTTHVQNIGWQGNENDPGTWKKDGEMAGTSGRGLRLEAIRICLTGEIAEHYDIYYRVHAQNVGWMGWAKNGEAAGTAGYSYRLEAIDIKLVPKGANPPGSTAGTYIMR